MPAFLRALTPRLRGTGSTLPRQALAADQAGGGMHGSESGPSLREMHAMDSPVTPPLERETDVPFGRPSLPPGAILDGSSYLQMTWTPLTHFARTAEADVAADDVLLIKAALHLSRSVPHLQLRSIERAISELGMSCWIQSFADRRTGCRAASARGGRAAAAGAVGSGEVTPTSQSRPAPQQPALLPPGDSGGGGGGGPPSSSGSACSVCSGATASIARQRRQPRHRRKQRWQVRPGYQLTMDTALQLHEQLKPNLLIGAPSRDLLGIVNPQL